MTKNRNLIALKLCDISVQHPLRTYISLSFFFYLYLVEYAWDDLYSSKLLTLQVYENKSHVYDPSKPGQGKPLKYENYIYIQFVESFHRLNLIKILIKYYV